MIKSFSASTLSANQATLTRVIHAKSSLPAMLFAGIGGFMAAPAKLQNPTSITNSNKQPITIKLDSSYVDYEFSHYTKRCRNKAHNAYIENGRDRRSKEEAGCYGDGFFLAPDWPDIYNEAMTFLLEQKRQADQAEAEHKKKMEV